MRITIDNAGKRFNFQWILQHVNLTFESGSHYAILGPNGSGKSTLLQMIAGVTAPSSGSLSYNHNDEAIDDEDIFRHISIAAPYIELIEEFNAAEMVSFHEQFKKLLPGITLNDVLRITLLTMDPSKQIVHYSSGMKQRLKIALAILSDVPVVLLDEPTTNLDQQGFQWYLDIIKKYSGNRLIIISSNLEREYSFCSEHVDVMKFKA